MKHLSIALFFAMIPIFSAGTSPSRMRARSEAQTKAKSAAPGQPGNRAASATKVRDLKLIDLSDYQSMLAKYRGKPIVVNFWATWCEPCRTEYPMLVELAKQYQPKGVVFLGVSYDEDADLHLVRKFLETNRPGFPNFRQKPGIDVDAFNHAVNPQWHGTIPSTIFYKADGRPDAQFVGTRPRAEFEEEIQNLLADPSAAK